MERIIDLHVHTTCSDGYLTPKQIIDRAVKNKVSVLSIADHDTIDAYSQELFDYAKQKGVKIIPAVEMSTRFKGIGIHVLGYKFNLNDEKIIKTLTKLKNARHDYLFAVSKKLEDLGYVVDIQKLNIIPSVTKSHIALDIILKSDNEMLLLDSFGHMPTKGEFIEMVLNENCPAYVEKFNISPIEASEIIHSAGGKVVLAHPVAYVHEDNVDDDWILNMVKQMNIDGIESYYLYVNRNEQEVDEIEFWNNFAKENNLFSTIGSDFHIADEIRPDIGFVNKTLELSETQIDEILNNLNK